MSPGEYDWSVSKQRPKPSSVVLGGLRERKVLGYSPVLGDGRALLLLYVTFPECFSQIGPTGPTGPTGQRTSKR